jgi:branched-chain amino acid transport system ATP-binding protein
VSALIEVAGVSKAFGGVQALSACELTVAEGSITGLIGPNGSGKTTLFNVITGYERIQQGEVRFNGAPITNARPDRVFNLGIGRTFQLTRLFGRLSVLENMLVATQRHEGWLRGVLRLAGSASERRRALELLDFVGIARLAQEAAANLSYGQRKLLELASLLVADPAVLLLDEPAGGVNPTLIGHLADRIKELNRAGKTFLVVEHNMEFVMGLCDQVTVLSEGKTLCSGTPERVRSDPAVLDAYLGGGDDADTGDQLAAIVAEPGGRVRSTVAPPAVIQRSPASGGAKPLLTVRGLTAGYGGGDILKDVSIDVAEGGITCIVGPNGAGKSTLLKAVSGLLRPRLGEIHFRGEPLADRSPAEILARGIAQIPQAHSLFTEMTVRENVEMGAYTIRDRALVAQRLDAVEQLFPIVRERAGEKAGSLSGGQQRLVEFARCLMLEPSLIVLDEPSMGLDPQTRALVFGMVELMHQQGKTILLVEQNARAGLKLSTRGVVLENGMVRLTGSGQEVLEHPEIGALYLGGAIAETPAA